MKKTMLCLLIISQCLNSLAQDKKLLYEIGFVSGGNFYSNYKLAPGGVVGLANHLRYPILDLTETSELDFTFYPSIGVFMNDGKVSAQRSNDLVFSFYTPMSIDYAMGNRRREYDYQRFGLVSGLGFATAYSSVNNYSSGLFAGPEVNVGLRARFFGREHFYRIGLMADVLKTKEIDQTYQLSIVFSRPFRKNNSGGGNSRLNRLNINNGTYF
jgi:hypothetical protein